VRLHALEQRDEPAAIGGRQRREQLLLNAREDVVQCLELLAAKRGDRDDVAPPVLRIGGALDEPPAAELLGRTEKALNAILDRELAGTGVTEAQWVTLTLTVMSGGTVERDELVGRVAGGLKIGDAEARARINELGAAQLLQVRADAELAAT
jgi:hypothetical protein